MPPDTGRPTAGSGGRRLTDARHLDEPIREAAGRPQDKILPRHLELDTPSEDREPTLSETAGV